MIDKIRNAFFEALPKENIKNLLTRQRTVTLEQFTGSSLSLFLSEAAGIYSRLLVVTPDMESAASYASDLQVLTGDDRLLIFPPTRRKPYDDQKIPDLSASVQRSDVLEKLKSRERAVVITSADALCEKLISSEEFQEHSFLIQTGDNLPPDELSEKLAGQGYRPVRFVDEPGEFAVRGGIFDIFPFSSEYPVRLEFFGDEIESLREFDTDSQRSVAFLNEIRLVPDAGAANRSEKQSLFDYLPDDTLVHLHEPDLIRTHIAGFMEEAEKIYTDKKESDLQLPDKEYLSPEELEISLKRFRTLLSGTFRETAASGGESLNIQSAPHPQFNGSFKLLRSWIEEQSREGMEIIILCENQNQRERYEELLGEPADNFRYRIGVFVLHEGFLLPEQKLAILTDHQIFNRYHRPQIKKRKSYSGGISFKELKDLNVGDYVVHVDYGIGKFAGFRKIKVKDVVQESAVLTYQGDSTLYVNVSSLHKLKKYSGKEGVAPRITRLGSGEWARKKARTKSKVKDIARELIELYAKRKAKQAHQFSPDTPWQMEMEARFEFEETADQLKAIEAVKSDMESDQPMDRLICGDVGFGKTEVSIRAAFKAVMDQKQVAVLVPTTILADQHWKTFTKRMKDFPIRIEVLSRFRTTAEQKQVIKELKAGNVDILIGTHRIVSKDVEFKDLGLMVIDEEQRFGVSVKEKLKEFRATVDVLTMTATPIPRTMQFSLMGARDLSIIHTPPVNRQPVYTEIHSFNQELIRDGILQEISRGGQIFFVHNRVKNIEEVAEMVRQLVPDIRVRFAHGQMTSSRLEKIIHDFYNHRFDVLLSTNIIENGIDIPNANTIIINNANHFGLSELHQLRGRVGRSMRKAFCYLLTPPIRTLTAEARKRLRALEEYSDLGSGFNIAMRDLDIRGAGDILGAEQSGFINELGFEMYTKILDDAVRELKEQEFGDLFEHEQPNRNYPETQVEFDASALLETDYVADNVERLNLYRKLAEAESMEQIDAWQEELTDRFGPLPETGWNLMTAARIKLAGSRLYLTKVTVRAGRMWLSFPANKSESGEEFYQSGLFQKILERVTAISGEEFRLIQKKEAVRLVIQEIGGIGDALSFLEQIVGSELSAREEVTV